MISRSQPYQHIIAFEVAKTSLTVHVLPADRQENVANTPAAIRRVLRRELRVSPKLGLGPILVVCEATGGYERHVLAEALALGLALHRAHGVRTRYFARYLGLAKTDPIDARMLALYGRDTPNLRLYEPPVPQQAALAALRKRQDDLKTMIRMESNRLEHACHPGVVVCDSAESRQNSSSPPSCERSSSSSMPSSETDTQPVPQKLDHKDGR